LQRNGCNPFFVVRRGHAAWPSSDFPALLSGLRPWVAAGRVMVSGKAVLPISPPRGPLTNPLPGHICYLAIWPRGCHAGTQD
jgi:hypothetical protein